MGIDGVYRDPWGNPYIITIDLNYDNRTRDSYYRRDDVGGDATGKGKYGLSKTGGPNSFEATAVVLVWSLGPDGRTGGTYIGGDKNRDKILDKDNVLSWK